VVLHELKIAPEYMELQMRGDKEFEIRKNDKNFQVGDLIDLREYENRKYLGRELLVEITCVIDYAQREGFVVLGTNRLKVIKY